MNDPLAGMPGYILRRASTAAFANVGERVAAFGVRPAEASILVLIAHNPAVTQSEVGAALGIQRANMTPLIARLEEQGWLRREPLDGRSQALVLTPAGQSLQGRVWTALEAYEAELTQAVPPPHRPHILPVLIALWEASQARAPERDAPAAERAGSRRA